MDEGLERPLVVLSGDVAFPQVVGLVDEPPTLVQSMLEELFGAL